MTDNTDVFFVINKDNIFIAYDGKTSTLNSTFPSYEKIKQNNPLPSICGRICSAPCEDACVLTEEDAPIGIKALERYAADFGRMRPVQKNGRVRKDK